MNDVTQADQAGSGLNRRTVLKTAAWSIPVLSVAVATPLAAASVAPGVFVAPDVTIVEFTEFSDVGFTAGFNFDQISPIPTSSPSAPVDWLTFDVDPNQPGIQSSVTVPVPTQPGQFVTVSFDPSTRMVSVQMLFGTDYDAVTPLPYQVQDSNGVLSTVGNIFISLPV